MKLRWINLFCFFVCSLACNTPHTNPVIIIDTNFGTIEAELYPNKAPKTVAAILQHVQNGIYTNSSFYRVLSEDNQPIGNAEATLIQGGIWKIKNKPANILPIPHESTNITGLHHINGTLSMARDAPGTATTEFFICIDDQPGFDFGGQNNADGQGYAAFGKVIKGMDVVRKIYRQPESEQRFTPPVKIISIKVD